jgi:hypothetical protein
MYTEIRFRYRTVYIIKCCITSHINMVQNLPKYRFIYKKIKVSYADVIHKFTMCNTCIRKYIMDISHVIKNVYLILRGNNPKSSTVTPTFSIDLFHESLLLKKIISACLNFPSLP